MATKGRFRCERKGGGELGHDERIVGAAAGDDKLVDFVMWKHEPVERADDRERGKEGGGADEVVRLSLMAAAKGKNFFEVGAAIVLAACGFGRREAEIGVKEEFIE